MTTVTGARIDVQVERAVRQFIARLATRYKIAGTILFGSRALQAHHSDSDADVAVLLQGQCQRFVSTKFAMADVAFDVLLETGISISPLPVWLDEWDNPDAYPNPQLLQTIARKGVRL